MKRFLIIVLIFLTLGNANAQFSKATLQASGLTCAMCSNAINKALQKLSFIATVRSDIKNSSFSITLKPGVELNIDAMKLAVEDAGFSVASLKLTGRFENLEIANERHIKIGNDNFHFIHVNNQTLNGEQTLTIIDRNYMSSKDFKKYSGASKMSCLQTGKADACCVKFGIVAGARVYHVTI